MHSTETMAALLKRYDIHAPSSDERFLGHADVERGTQFFITYSDDPRLGKHVLVRCGRFESYAPCPLDDERASRIVAHLQKLHLVPNRAQERKTLEHLLLRGSELYVREELERFQLGPVYLRRNDYSVTNAAMTPQRVAEDRRLEPHAHDKGAVFAYRPTARRKHARTNNDQT